ncbi:hypothetical protein ABK040_012863 [Willaertia magna]
MKIDNILLLSFVLFLAIGSLLAQQHNAILRSEQNLQFMMKRMPQTYMKSIHNNLNNPTTLLHSISLNNNERSLQEEEKVNPFVKTSSHWSRKINNHHRTIMTDQKHLIVRFNSKMNPKLIESSYVTFTFLGNNTFTSVASFNQIEQLLKDDNVELISEYRPLLKFSISNFPEELLEEEEQNDISIVDIFGNQRNLQNNFKLPDPLDHLFKQNKKDKRDSFLTFKNENGKEYFLLRILLEKNSKRDVIQSFINDLLKVKENTIYSHQFSGNDKLILSVEKQDVLALSFELAKRSDVFWIELIPKYELHNKWTRGIIQGGAPFKESISTRGLMGQGQIVTVGDSGLDGNSCFFYDAINAVPFVNSTKEAIAMNSSHRKITSYWGFMDTISENNAHGTHVSGSVLGNAPSGSSLKEYNGMAQEAKVAFIDLGCTNPDGCSCHGTDCYCNLLKDKKCPPSDRAIYPPDLYKDYFPFANALGSKILTSSWGGGAMLGYSTDSVDIDKFVWENKDFLVTFSAGNSGSYGYVTLSTQAESKNVISVGASVNNANAFRYALLNATDYNSIAKSNAETLISYLGCPEPGLTSSSTCSQFDSNFTAVCDFLRTFKTEKDCCSQEGFCAPKSEDSASCGCNLYGLGNTCCKKCREAIYNGPILDIVYTQESIAPFSSLGPTTDGRIKPEIVAPGYVVISAKSYDTSSNPTVCSESKQSLLGMSGTSMSNPVVAGASALVRQYFIEGWYPNGKKDESKGFNPSAALLKATLIGSAAPLASLHPTYSVEYVSQYRFIEGFGRIRLEDALYFEGDSQVLLIGRQENIKNSTNIKTEFGDPIIQNVDESHTYCVTPKDGKAKNIRVSLVWTDYPSSPARYQHLVNNLDLGIKIGKDIYFGNSLHKNTFQRDSVNNVEVLNFESIEDKMIINVAASYIYEKQPYALVITGEKIKFEVCKADDVFEYSPIGKNNNQNNNNNGGNDLSTGIRIFGFDLALVFVGVFLLLVVILVATIVSCAFSGYLYYRSKQSATSFAKLEDETNQRL